ncbi:carboxy terminal-processing peptidase [Cognatiluteimonas lumbrici]|uniref:carboxy terminal-processing peptidase n=1 Tax=Cognatiluteimonas lumbrici TaxID=2559601 RepID=UPI00112C3B03|nr:carboxy terminal-processing peptidase [Luteimonas lumbrici]
MKTPRTLLVLALVAPLALLARPQAATSQAGESLGQGPTADQVTTAKLVYGLLSDSRYAYRPQPLDDALSADIFDRYLEALDPGRMLFTAADVERFARYRTALDDAIKSGKLEPAYAMFALYQQRMNERSAYARKLLGQDIFDFTGDDRWHYDREDVPWAKSAAELDKAWRQSVRNDWLRLKLAGKEPAEIRKTLDKRYANMAENANELDATDAFTSFINAYTGSIDPHTDYFDPRSAERFNQSMSLSLEGIGAQLQKQDDVVVIREVLPGGPAIKSGQLEAGDRIVGVGQGDSGPMEDVVGWRIDDVVAKIKGPKGTKVRLDIIPPEAGMDSKPRRVVLVRDRIRLTEQAAKSKILEVPARGDLPARRIGVIELPGFYQDFAGRRSNKADYVSATRDVARLLAQFRERKVDGVVMDLRNNGGGSLAEAVELTGLFIDQGPVVQVRESGGRVSVESDRDPGVAWDGPLAVLVNRGSASASEIFAGAIQDYGRGLVVGEPTFGKGTVQNLVDLDRWPGNEETRFGQVKLTIAQFFLPGGSSTQNKGVIPDITFPVSVDASEFGESTYDNALPWTRIAPVPHKRYGNFTPMLAQLDALHDARVRENKEFQWWAEDVARFRSERAKGFVSLNEAERRAERDAEAARRKQRQELRKELGLKLDPLATTVLDDGLQANERNVVEDAAREKAAEDRPDPLLREAAAILADATALLVEDQKLAAQVLTETGRATHWAE